MNAIMDWLQGAGACRLGWTLVHSLWQGTLIAGVFAVARIALRRSSAQARYLLACGALALLAAAPVLTFLHGPDAWFPASLHMHGPTPATGGTVALAGAQAGPVFAAGAETAPWVSSAAALLTRSVPWFVAAWLSGVALFLARWLQGCWWVRRVKRQCVAEVEPEWLERLNDLKCRLAVSRPVRLLQSAVVEVPMVVGWWRPVLLLPASALTGLSPMQLEAILAHELAHVRRHDYLVNSLQLLLEALLFYHPATWWLSHCIRQEREHCCDDLVVTLCGDRLGYARALMTLEELRGGGLQLALAAGGGSLLHRIRRLLGAPTGQPVGTREFSGLALIGLGCACMFAGLGLMFAPRDYQAACRIKVQPEQVTSADGVSRYGAYAPWFIQTEFEVLQSPVVLNRVVDSLQLTNKWAKPGGSALDRAKAVQRLQSRLHLRPIRNTSLVELQVVDSDPDEAARIANAVAEAYRQYRSSSQSRRLEARFMALDQRRSELERNLHDAQKQVDEQRSKLNLPAGLLGAPDVTAAVQSMAAETLRHIETLRVDTQSELVRQDTLLEKLKALSAHSDQLAEVLPTTGIADSLLTSLLEQKTVAEQKLLSLQREYGPQHSEVVKVASQVADLREKLRQREEGILTGLEVRVASLQEGLANLQAEAARATQAQTDFASQAQPYLQARNRLEELQKIHQDLDMRIVSERMDLALSREPAVELIESAVAPGRPASPNTAFGAALLGSGLLLALFGILLARGGPGHHGTPIPVTA